MEEKSTRLEVLFKYVEFIYFWIYESLKSTIRTLFAQPKSLEDQVALVTGGANGLGRALCLRLGSEGVNVAVADVDFANAEEVARELRERYYVKAKAYKVDVSDYYAIVALKDAIERDLGPVDILVNNAAILFGDLLQELEPKPFDRFNAINLNSHFWTIKTFLPGMIERKRGHIVGLSSVTAIVGVPIEIPYVASKFGVRGLMLALRQTLFLDRQASYIKTTTVYPYYVETQQFLIEFSQKSLKLKQTYTKPEEAAKTIIRAVRLNKDEIFVPRTFGIFRFFITQEGFWKARCRTLLNREASYVRPKKK